MSPCQTQHDTTDTYDYIESCDFLINATLWHWHI